MTPAHPLKPLLDRQIRALRRSLTRAMAGDIEPLHQSRVATRRLRELLPLCASGAKLTGCRQVRRHLKRLGRVLGAVREIDVMLALLDELESRRPTAIGRLRQYLQEQRARARARMRDRLTPAVRRKLDRRLDEVDGQLRHAEDVTAWIAPLGLRIARRAGRVEKTVEAAGAVYAQERVHAVRIAVKQLRYALELAHETGQARVVRAIRTTRAVQDTLGRLHDLEVLQTETGEVGAMTSADAAWAAEVAHLGHDLERQCRELHGRYVRRRASLLNVCQVAHAVADRILKGPQRVARGRVLKMTLPRVARRTRRTATGQP